MTSPSKNGIQRTVLFAGILLLASAFAILIDVQVTQNRNSGYVAGDFRRIVQLSEIFAHGFGIAVVIYMIWVLAPERRRWIPRLATCAILPGLVVQCCKLFIARRRPGFYWPEFADQVADTWIGILPGGQLNVDYVTQSFPSAHAATAVGLAAGLAWLFPQGRYAFFVLGFLGAFQRVVAGAHWTSDVLAGAAIGVLVCGLVSNSRLLQRAFRRIESASMLTPNEVRDEAVVATPTHDSERRAA